MKNDYRYDSLGNLDTDYYVEKAYEMRREYFALLVKKAFTSVKNIFSGFAASRHSQGHTAN
ncbi:hypothetical protein MSP8887_04303 [Marinomonas spartinae]|uniref:Uncharacterized protein n=1 Tax=Marinomonas spartinae TaxID=1792290 RepID=A0A1A8T5B6_9GAMM|nr:hypothetical protein [Marinomonas spartinae]SBS26776.1 hypothetical protein MSP8886_00701 [Marinomonas spartinae]SBS40306.1 hypothetical protein MSP8887_04303 [Marinomonas spartinae]